jgi:hypothetical protein
VTPAFRRRRHARFAFVLGVDFLANPVPETLMPLRRQGGG